MADILNKDPEKYAREKQLFYHRLRKFHLSRGTSFRTVNSVGNEEIDLYLMYWVVTANGGYDKVNSHNLWDDFLTIFKIPESTTNGSILLKHTYLRCLETYERVNFTCDEDDDSYDTFDDDSSSRFRRTPHRLGSVHGTASKTGTSGSGTASLGTSAVPLTYNHKQHDIKYEDRQSLNLCCKVYTKSEYDKLIMSLVSPLPNEHDFAINICTLLSNEGRRTLRFQKCPRLLDYILAHAGVYNHSSLKRYLSTIYRQARRYHFSQFWRQTCAQSNRAAVDLMLERCDEPSLYNSTSSSRHNISSDFTTSDTVGDLEEDDTNYFADIPSSGNDRHCARTRSATTSSVDDGVHERCGHRVQQVATIVRNLSFETDNAQFMGTSEACIRFAILCAFSEWSSLLQAGLDILCNVCCHVRLSSATDTIDQTSLNDAMTAPSLRPTFKYPFLTETLLSVVSDNIKSVDRFRLISSMDVLSQLVQVEANALFFTHLLTSDTNFMFGPLLSYLTLNDVHLLASALECLYAITTLGQAACIALASVRGAIEQFISLVSVEAQSYGPGACILMRVVETVPLAQSSPARPAESNDAPTMAPGREGQVLMHKQQPSQQQPIFTAAQNQAMTTNPASPQLLAALQQRHEAAAVAASPVTSTVNGQAMTQVLAHPPGGGPPRMVLIPSQALINATNARQPIGAIAQQPQQQQRIAIANQHVQVVQTIPPNQTLPCGVAKSPVPASTKVNGDVSSSVIRDQSPAVLSTPRQQEQSPPNVILQPRQDVANNAGKSATMTQNHKLVQSETATTKQQVQLRVSNDEANRAFCVAWLQATYELAPPTLVMSQNGQRQQVQQHSIHHDIMYKQYLASLHKLGKQDVVSAQQYAVSVRSVFGPNVGPNRRPVETKVAGTYSFEFFYDHIRVRQQPLQMQWVAPTTTAPAATVTSHPTSSRTSSPSLVATASASTAGTAHAPPILTSLLQQQQQQKNSNIGNGNASVSVLNSSAMCNGVPSTVVSGHGASVSSSEHDTTPVTTAPTRLTNGDVDHATKCAITDASIRVKSDGISRPVLSNGIVSPGDCDNVDNQPDVKKSRLDSGDSTASNASHSLQAKQQHGQQQMTVSNVAPRSATLPISMQNGNHVNNEKVVAESPKVLRSNDTNNNQSSSTVVNGDASTSTTTATTVTKSISGSSNVTAKANATSDKVGQPVVNAESPYLCEWAGCNRSFRSPAQVECHALAEHCTARGNCVSDINAAPSTLLACMWARCDPTVMRTPFSLMTHLQDKHCHPQVMRLMAVRRVQLSTQGRSDIAVPAVTSAHPGYSANAALVAIRRHAAEFVPAKASIWSDEREGPVTKSLRITAALILRNLVLYSPLARRRVRAFESHLSNIGLSNVESSRTIAQLMFELSTLTAASPTTTSTSQTKVATL